jgi:hypothetical protein
MEIIFSAREGGTRSLAHHLPSVLLEIALSFFLQSTFQVIDQEHRETAHGPLRLQLP